MRSAFSHFLRIKFLKKKIITITKEIEKKYNVKYLLNQVFGKQVKVFVLKSKTKSASETVFRTIKNFKLKGQVIVKDSDSYFNLDKKFKYLNTNFIAGVDISEHPEVHNIHQKSFLNLAETSK